MTKNVVSNKRRGANVVNIVAVLAVGGVLSWFGFNASGQDAASAPETPTTVVAASAPADLERTFWFCDYAGTNGSVDSGTALACSTVTEDLKNQKFNGDFDALVAWWRQNKQAEHQAIATAIPDRLAGKAASSGN